jgi:hypothetical protein
VVEASCFKSIAGLRAPWMGHLSYVSQYVVLYVACDTSFGVVP